MVESGPVAVESVGTAAGSTTLVVAVLGTPGDHDFVLRDAVGQEKWRVVGSLTPAPPALRPGVVPIRGRSTALHDAAGASAGDGDAIASFAEQPEFINAEEAIGRTPAWCGNHAVRPVFWRRSTGRSPGRGPYAGARRAVVVVAGGGGAPSQILCRRGVRSPRARAVPCTEAPLRHPLAECS
jgi:hypothetical protein